MRNVFAILITILILTSCSEKGSNHEIQQGSEEPTIETPNIESMGLIIENNTEVEINVKINDETIKCKKGQTCDIKAIENAEVSLELDLIKNNSFLLDSWGNDTCSDRASRCNFTIKSNQTFKVTGLDIDFIASSGLVFTKQDRAYYSVMTRSAVISIPDRLFVQEGISTNKKVVIKFRNGQCVYDWSTDVCGIAHCDPTKVVGLKSCEFDDIPYTTKDLINGYLDLSDHMMILSIQLIGKIKDSERFVLGFEFPVQSWSYDNESIMNFKKLN